MADYPDRISRSHAMKACRSSRRGIGALICDGLKLHLSTFRRN